MPFGAISTTIHRAPCTMHNIKTMVVETPVWVLFKNSFRFLFSFLLFYRHTLMIPIAIIHLATTVCIFFCSGRFSLECLTIRKHTIFMGNLQLKIYPVRFIWNWLPFLCFSPLSTDVLVKSKTYFFILFLGCPVCSQWNSVLSFGLLFGRGVVVVVGTDQTIVGWALFPQQLAH